VTTDRGGYRVPIRNPLRVPAVLALVAALARLPFIDRPLSPDEGGFLLLAGQWSPGSSLYGDYWVDRPPLLIGLFGLADHLGGTVALRVVGMVAVAVAVVLAGVLGSVAAPGRRWAATLTAATAAVFLSTPLFGTREVNGELLAVPFLLGGLVAVLLAVEGRRRARLWWAVAGVLAIAAMAVKQNMADVAVAGLVALVWQLRVRGLRRAAYDALAAAAGAVAAVAVLVVWAETMGTEPRALWDAAVRFRFEAAAVISADDPGVTAERLRSMLHALALSGAPVLYLLPLLAVPRARERGSLPFMAAAVSLWEIIGVAAGGSYWWHYLVGLVPGLVLVVAALVRHRPGLQAPVAALLVYATLIGLEVDRQADDVSVRLRETAAAADFLADHKSPGDTGVVAYGAPSILREAGVRSPYEYLWSLPVRVRDPDLTELSRIMRGPDRPTWMIVQADTLDTWAIHPDTAQELLDRDYRLVGVVGPWRFFHVDGPVHSGAG
jgi:hypothetical protein